MNSDPFRRRSLIPGSVLRAATKWLLVVVTTMAFWSCGESAPMSQGTQAQLSDNQDPEPLFTDETQASGLDFQHQTGATGHYYFPEMGGPGGALVDVDNDGDLDLYAVQGTTTLDDSHPTAAIVPPGGALRDRLYLSEANPSARATGSPITWRDVTEASGLEASGYGMGVAVGDMDNDGWPDLYITNFGPNQLWRNRGDGTFEDRTSIAGVDDPRWSTSAIFLDFDRDGWLDLFVTTYVDYRIGSHRTCRGPTGRTEYCGPQAYSGDHDRLFRNQGDGTFVNVTAQAGLLASHAGSGLGVVAADFDSDGWIDLYVANDLMPNQLWHNRGFGPSRSHGPSRHLGFAEWGLLTGSALDLEGKAQASMGVDVGDLDNDGDEDLFMTHLVGDINTVYLNDGRGMFSDRSRAAGMRQSTPYTGFGTVILDVDNDGRLDIAAVHGAVAAVPELAAAGDNFPYDQPNQLFLNRPGDRDSSPKFVDVSDRAGDSFTRAETSRGLAVGDVDNDGDQDLVVFNTGGPARLLINRVGQDKAWVGLRLVGMAGRRDMLGTRVELLLDERPPRVRRVRTGASYLSAGDSRVLFGLGDLEEAPAGVQFRVEWPDGVTEHFGPLTVGKYHTLVMGSKRSQESP